MRSSATDPKLSIVVICFNMRREAARTLYTLSHQYQRNISPSDYQVIVIDNGSSSKLERAFVEGIGPNFEYHYFDTNSPSPVAAINYGANLAKSRYIGYIVDGARMITPGVIHYALQACEGTPHPFVTALAWHLGPKEQNHSMLEGYDQHTEDALLESIDWSDNGYRLFEIASQAGSSSVGFLGGLPHESSFFVLKRSDFLKLGGFDSRFRSPGGGLVNHDFLERVVNSEKFNYTVLLGEGSFHQFHGGIATNVAPEKHPMDTFQDEYRSIHGTDFSGIAQPGDGEINYLGSMTTAAAIFISGSV